MGFTLGFLVQLSRRLVDGAPLFVGLGAIIAAIAIVVGRREGWSTGDSLYFGFITATTVGYGDLRPRRGASKLLAVVLALLGLITTGVLVALAVEAAAATLELRRAS
jgi:voltage-gated potassium channel